MKQSQSMAKSEKQRQQSKKKKHPKVLIEVVKVNLKTNIIGEKDINEDYLKCKLCEYKCKKDALLKKHIKTKHQEYKCKLCDVKGC